MAAPVFVQMVLVTNKTCYMNNSEYSECYIFLYFFFFKGEGGGGVGTMSFIHQ